MNDVGGGEAARAHGDENEKRIEELVYLKNKKKITENRKKKMWRKRIEENCP